MKITDKRLENKEYYNTDKLHDYSGSMFSHDYGDYYNNILEPLENEKINLLEIGVQKGGSVRLFSDYLKKSKIIGVDIINQWAGPLIENYPNLSLYFFDAYNLVNIDNLPINEFDIIIDDGPHTIESQIFFLSNFNKYLKCGGKLVLEDVQYKNLEIILDRITCDKTKIKVFDLHNNYNVSDDILIEYSND